MSSFREMNEKTALEMFAACEQAWKERTGSDPDKEGLDAALGAAMSMLADRYEKRQFPFFFEDIS